MNKRIIFLISWTLTFVISASAYPASREDAELVEVTDTIVGPLTHQSRLSKEELEIWNDPAFKQRFAESYIAETETEPRVTVDERELMLEVLELISADKMEEAAKRLLKSRNEASSAVFDFTLANIRFQEEELDQAAEGYEIAIKKYPKFLRAWRNLALIHVRRGEFRKAVPAFTRVIELGGNDAVTFGLLAYAYLSVENYLAAESAYRMAILLDPKTLDWKMGLAQSLFKQDRFADAAALCRCLIDDQPDDVKLWLLEANAYIGLNQPMKAAVIYEMVDHLGKSTATTLNMLGDIYINQELYKVAVDSYIRAMEKGLDDKPSRVIRSAKVLAARGALQETKRLLESIHRFYEKRLDDEDRKDLLKLKARLAVADPNMTPQDEVGILEEIVKLDPLDGEALILLGQHNQRIGDAEKAVFYYERAASIEKFEADAKVRHAQLLVARGKYAEALPLLRRAQLIKPRENVEKYLEQVERAARTNQ